MSKTAKAGIGMLVVVLCAVGFYFLYWTKTPTYSLNLIRESIQKHDVATFEKHVDMDSLYTKAVDDSIVAMDKIQGGDTLSNPFVAGFVQMLKPVAVEALKAATIAAVEGKDETTTETKKNDGSNFASGLRSKTDIEDATIKDVSTISNEGNEAVVAITLNNKKLGKDFTVNLKMAKLDDGTWKVKEVTNLVDFLVETDKAKKEKLAELNKPIQQELDTAITVSNASVEMQNDGNPFFASHWLLYKVDVANTTDKDIASFNVEVSAKDENNVVCKQTIIGHNATVLKAHTSLTGLTSQAELNQFIPDDNKIIKSKNVKQIEVKVVSITYADGTETKLLTKIPD